GGWLPTTGKQDGEREVRPGDVRVDVKQVWETASVFGDVRSERVGVDGVAGQHDGGIGGGTTELLATSKGLQRVVGGGDCLVGVAEQVTVVVAVVDAAVQVNKVEAVFTQHWRHGGGVKRFVFRVVVAKRTPPLGGTVRFLREGAHGAHQHGFDAVVDWGGHRSVSSLDRLCRVSSAGCVSWRKRCTVLEICKVIERATLNGWPSRYPP